MNPHISRYSSVVNERSMIQGSRFRVNNYFNAERPLFNLRRNAPLSLPIALRSSSNRGPLIIYIAFLLAFFCFLTSGATVAEASATVTIAWDQNQEPDVIGYKVHYGISSRNYENYQYTVDVNNNTSCTIGGLEEGKTYYIAVTAYNELFESDYSTELVVPVPLSNLVNDFVTRFYQLCLDRDPDAAGLEEWTNALLNQIITGADVAYGFIYSQEFINKNTTSDEYLTVLYNAFFDRQPDSAGFQGWLDALQNGLSREEVLNGFIYSQEFNDLCWLYGISANPVTAFVTRFYKHCLDRDPDKAGIEWWANDLLNKVITGADVANGFIYSQEFINKNTTNDEYLTILYKAFFNRDPDQGRLGCMDCRIKQWTRSQAMF